MTVLALLAASLVSTASLAELPACSEATKVDGFLAAARQGEEAFADMDMVGLSEARDLALQQIPCLDEPVNTETAAAFHRMMAMAAFTQGDEPGTLAEFHAARRLQPGYTIPEDVAPEGHPMVDLYKRSVSAAEGRLDPTIPPLGGWVTVDGVGGAPRPTGISTILQSFAADGTLEQTTYLLPGDPTPSFGPMPLDQLRRKRRRTALGGSAGAALLASAALYGASWASYGKFMDTDNPLPDSDLPTQRNTTNTLFFTSVGAGAVGLGLGVATVVMW
jgi:hypothetical protein